MNALKIVITNEWTIILIIRSGVNKGNSKITELKTHNYINKQNQSTTGKL
jgi:hypothetical protein